MNIKPWLLAKYSAGERYVIECAMADPDDCVKVLVETEKAVKVKFMTKYGNLTEWLPKSGIYQQDEIDARIKRMDSGLEYNQRLIEFAKAHKLRARRGMRTETVKRLIVAAGLEVPSR